MMISTKRFIILMILAIALLVLLMLDGNNRTPEPESAPEISTTTTEPSTTTTTVYVPLTSVTSIPRTAATIPVNVDDFFACIRQRESHGDYTAVNATGTFMGAYQFYQGGWDTFAARIGRQDLVGIPPHTASPADQDAIALAAYNELGSKPWGGACQ